MKYKTKDVIKMFGINGTTLHYWEEAGIFSFKNNPGTGKYKTYSEEDLIQVGIAFVLSQAGFPKNKLAVLVETAMDQQEWRKKHAKLRQANEYIFIKIDNYIGIQISIHHIITIIESYENKK